MIAAATGIFLILALPSLAQQQPDLGGFYNTTVTLYYYDNTNQTKGAFVDMPDNPQYVNVDPARAAPGMYTFAHVPSGHWYYLEADHQGNKWYTIFYMDDNVGTKTANVHIPPMRPVNVTSTETPMPPLETPALMPSYSPTATPAPAATPGMTFMAAILAGTVALALAFIKR